MFSFGADFRKRSLVSRRSHRSQSLLSSFAPLPCAPIASPPFIFRIVQVIPPVGASWLTTSIPNASVANSCSRSEISTASRYHYCYSGEGNR